MSELSGRKKEIIALAAELFREQGYSAASMRDIAKAASIQVSTLYSHFENKEDILMDICTAVHQELSTHPQELGESWSAKAKFKHLLKRHISYAITNPDYYLVCVKDWKQLMGNNLKKHQDSWNNYSNHFIQIIHEAKQKNKIAKITPHIIINTCLGAIQSNCQNMNITQPDKVNLTKQLSKLLINGLFKNKK